VHLICNKTESASVLTSKLEIILGFAFVAEIGGRRGLQKNREGVSYAFELEVPIFFGMHRLIVCLLRKRSMNVLFWV